MLQKNRKRSIGLCVMVVASCLVMVMWAILTTPGTVMAAKPDRPGGNVKQQDISTKVTLLSGSLTGDGSDVYIDGESNVDCKTGRRRSIWVDIGKNSNRTMTLTVGDEFPYDPDDSELPKVSVGDLGVALPGGDIDQVSLMIAVGDNVSGLGEEFVDNVLYCSPPKIDCMLTNMRMDFRDVVQGYNWRLYFGPGPLDGATWPGGFLFSNPNPDMNAYVTVIRTNPSHVGSGRIWQVRTTETDRNGNVGIPGFLYFKGTKPNEPMVYVGAFNIPWNCDAVSLE